MENYFQMNLLFYLLHTVSSGPFVEYSNCIISQPQSSPDVSSNLTSRVFNIMESSYCALLVLIAVSKKFRNV